MMMSGVKRRFSSPSASNGANSGGGDDDEDDDSNIVDEDRYVLPERWLECPRKGKFVADIFMPFKTPLDDHYDALVPEENRFSLPILLSAVSSAKRTMSLWIDLTNTDRYYDRSPLETHGIKFVKINCKGFGESPSPEVTSTFVAFCDRILKAHPTKLIGVHCTHGFNRTGFLIVAFLVEKLDYALEAAISEFAACRPPGIYKAHYLRELCHRYGDGIDNIPPAPNLPDWCYATMLGGEDDDDAGAEKRQGVSVRQLFGGALTKKLKLDESSHEFAFPGTPNVRLVTEAAEVIRVQNSTSKYCQMPRLQSFPGSQPVSMDINNVGQVEVKPYKVSWKADGTRYLMLIDGKNGVFLMDRDFAVFRVEHLKFPKRKDPYEGLVENTLLDGELVKDKTGEESFVLRFLIYDMVAFDDNRLEHFNFDQRLEAAKLEIILPRDRMVSERKLDKTAEPFSVRIKGFFPATSKNVKALLSPDFLRNLAHESDGLVFHPVNSPYKADRCFDLLKWKPPELNTIDYKLKVVKKGGVGQLDEWVGQLYMGGEPQPVDVLKGLPRKQLKALDGKVVECKYNQGTKTWELLRERKDKSYPNAKATVLGVWNSIKLPVTEEKLLKSLEAAETARFRAPPPMLPGPPPSQPPPPPAAAAAPSSAPV